MLSKICATNAFKTQAGAKKKDYGKQPLSFRSAYEVTAASLLSLKSLQAISTIEVLEGGNDASLMADWDDPFQKERKNFLEFFKAHADRQALSAETSARWDGNGFWRCCLHCC